MSYIDKLTLTPEFGLEESINFQTLITPMKTGKERRRAKWAYGLRSYKLNLYVYTKSAMDALWAFFVARKGIHDPFLVKIPTEYQVTTEAIGTGDGSATTFMLDEFPIDETAGTFTMYADGVEVDASLDNNFTGEYSTVTFDSAPAADAVLTGDYEFFFYVRFTVDKFSRELIAYQLLNSGLEMSEQRWVYYRPRSGNQYLLKAQASSDVSVDEFADGYKFRAVDLNEPISITINIDTLFEPLGVIVNDSVSITSNVDTLFEPLGLILNDNSSINDGSEEDIT